MGIRRVVALVVAVVSGVAISLAPAGPTAAWAQEADDAWVAAAAAPETVAAFGGAPFHGSTGTNPLAASVSAIAVPPGGNGYWLAAADGGVFTFGATAFAGSAATMPLAGYVVGMASSASGEGYWLVTDRGGVYAFGDSPFLGAVTGGPPLNGAVVSIVPTPSGAGYWLVGADGGVFTYGDARYLGGLGDLRLNAPIVAAAATPTGEGYWLVAADGGLFAFGDAPVLGSLADAGLMAPITGAAATRTGKGLVLVGADGGVFTFGDATFAGARTGAIPDGRIAGGIATDPAGAGYWVFDTAPLMPEVSGPPIPAGSGSGRRVIYSNSRQRVWIVEPGERLVGTWLVSGRAGVPRPGHYRVFSKSPSTVSGNGAVGMRWMVRFAHGSSLAIGFHSIPTYPSGRPIQSEAELGRFRSAGCVRQRLADAKRLYDWAPIGTPVIVLA